MKLSDKELLEAVELLHAGYVNLTYNFCEQHRILRENPMYLVVKMQLAEGLKLLGRNVE